MEMEEGSEISIEEIEIKDTYKVTNYKDVSIEIVSSGSDDY